MKKCEDRKNNDHRPVLCCGVLWFGAWTRVASVIMCSFRRDVVTTGARSVGRSGRRGVECSAPVLLLLPRPGWTSGWGGRRCPCKLLKRMSSPQRARSVELPGRRGVVSSAPVVLCFGVLV
ncbi:hypothetical protein Zmor_010929 [Zophobas morio]|uniref:Uncharacterized protein n=1 Tax=Zophobas morio TaxID=2755281 RepID=A0AA38MKG0_9CUCU|nr:hypothetical protein Zmor_010929 [Zophobas morio]